LVHLNHATVASGNHDVDRQKRANTQPKNCAHRSFDEDRRSIKKLARLGPPSTEEDSQQGGKHRRLHVKESRFGINALRDGVVSLDVIPFTDSRVERKMNTGAARARGEPKSH
jgi:hypothetical protein